MPPSENVPHLYENVINSIRGMIIRGELKQGDRIPPERELAEHFNVSRVPVREALKILEYMGVLDSSPGDGTYVRNVTIEDMVKKMNFAVTATADTVMDLLELRITLECFAARQASLRHTPEDIESLRQTLLNMRNHKRMLNPTEENINYLRELSHEFHRGLIRAAHNAVLSNVYDSLYELLDISRQYTIGSSGISYNSIMAHEVIFNRIAAGDADGAAEAVAEHLSDVRLKLNSSLVNPEQLELSFSNE